MIFACAAAAAVTAASHSPSWFLNGAYHPPLPGRSSDNLLHAIGSANAQGGAAIDGEALTVALDVVQAWAVLLTLGFTLIIFFFLAFCVCSKKDDGYDEFEISHGITTVKICHDGGENGVSLIPRINGSGTLSMKATDETSEASSRYTLKRELPAIPTNTQDKLQGKSERPVSQHSSDLYASVSDSNQGSSNVKLIGGVQVLPAGAIAPGGRAAVIKECITSPDPDQIEKGKKKKEKTEHAYAKVTTREAKEIEKSSFEDPKTIALDKREKLSEIRQQTAAFKSEKRQDDVTSPKPLSFGQPIRDQGSKSGIVTSPTALTSVHSTFPTPHSTNVCSPTSIQSRFPTSPNQPIPQPNIPAALAISGRQPANEEMPYMTPPILQASRERDQQERYSGDSQDLRGYTSISVREPLAALKARQNAEEGPMGRGSGLTGRSTGLRSGLSSTQGPDGEGYYMTVSDDSADEMYACIYEGGSRGTGSETYAQIEPRITPSSTQPPTSIQSLSNLPSSPTQLTRSQEQSPPAPPSVDSLRHVVHSRQASASSATSTGMGSPVAEKRGTRSPLPPLPQGDISLYSPPDPPIVSSQSVPKSPPKATTHFVEKIPPRSLEEMYAKVIKKPSGHSRGGSAGSESEGKITNSRRGSAEVAISRWVSATSPIASKTTQDMTHSMVETRSHDMTGVSRVKSCDVSGSWSGADKEGISSMQGNRTSGNYESIPSQGGSLYSGSDPGYETVKNGEPPYASVGPSENYPGYETVRGADMDAEEPGYETLKPKESEPGYETVAEVSSKKTASVTGYESLFNIGSSSSDFEPGYETVSSSLPSDPGYESVHEKTKIDNDPCYEELSHPNHPRTSSENDPNYEQLKFTSSRKSSEEGGGDSGYEVVKKQVVEGNYELVSDYDTQEKNALLEQDVFLPQAAQVTQEVPLYASVKKRESPKKEQVDALISNYQTKDESNENSNVDASLLLEKEAEILHHPKTDLLCDINDLITDLTKQQAPSISSTGMTAFDDIVGISFAQLSSTAPVTLPVNDEDISDSKKEDDSSDILKESQPYLVMDSPEDVELPPPGEDSNIFIPEPLISESEQVSEQRIEKSAEVNFFCPGTKEDLGIDSTQSLVSLTFTAASPPTGSPEVNSPRSSASSTNSSKEEQMEQPASKEEAKSEQVLEETDLVSAPPPPQFDEIEDQTEIANDPPLSNNADDLLPPPPLPILDDDVATASPPPPPPPLPDEGNPTQEFPLPPVCQDIETNVENINGVSPTMIHPVNDNFETDLQTQPSSCYQVVQSPLGDSDMPPPPLFQSSQEEDLTFPGNVNGNITVTVNPMAAIEDENSIPETPLSSVIATTVTVQHASNGTNSHVAAIGTSSGESQSSGSTANGNGSVESVVTVDAKTGADPSTTVPVTTPAPSLQHSSSTSSSSSESKHSDPTEGITSV